MFQGLDEPTRNRVLRTVLRPIVRSWLRGANSLQQFVDLLKVTFVEIAVEEMLNDGLKVNYSRISLMTGVHRTDVSKICKEGAPAERALQDVVTRVLGHWEQNAQYRTAQGKARTLSFKGAESEFAELVSSISKNVKAGSVLFELERIGAVERRGDRLRLVGVLHRSEGNSSRAAEIAARDIQALLETAERNVSRSEDDLDVYLQTEYDNIFLEDVPKIRRWLMGEAKAFHRRVRDFLSACDKDVNDRPGKVAGVRVSLTDVSNVQLRERLEWSAGDPLRRLVSEPDS
ncbi:MAG: hypothetical protein KDD44_09920 [Bdellovibrionales bacterium]|nr:hypothetical protein [Bdellovibrionales bacterium]